MLEFSIGDEIMHPRHGAGLVTDMITQELVEGFTDYYVISIPEKRLKMHIPVGRADEVGIRPVMREKKLDAVLEALRNVPRRLPDDHKKRQAELRKKLQIGRPMEIAEVVRDLSWHDYFERLTKTDTDLLNRGREFLAAEMALVTDVDPLEAKQQIDDTLMTAQKTLDL